MKESTRFGSRIALTLLGGLAGGFALSRFLNYHPRPVESVQCLNQTGAPDLPCDRPVKLITYNTQFLAGTKYDFFYDGGRDIFVAPEDVVDTTKAISQFLADQNPDFIFLQEVDCGARRTGYLDEVELLVHSLPSEFRNHAEAFYWKSRFVPHPKIMGSVGTKLAIFSKYRLVGAWRYQLPCTPSNPVVSDFNFKRAILQVEVRLANGKSFYLLNTHLEAFPGRTNIMTRQVDTVLERLQSLDWQQAPWILGGDFNLLPPGQWALLNSVERGCHREPSEISAIYERYKGVPAMEDASGENMRSFMTFTKRFEGGRVPIRTLDYFFVSPQVKICRYSVLQKESLHLSDHLPLVAEVELSATPF
jgi:endonuclease/exonuclease/phosphatase family metal-dependent hydrolase